MGASFQAPSDPRAPSAGPGQTVASYTILTVGVQTRCMRILVVDDEPRVRSALKRALTLDGYEVEVAADGSQALRFLSTDSADAIVLDILMPEVNGIEVCRRLRKSGDRTPVLVLSARDAVADRVAGLDVGADDYLVKPFDLDELLARLRALLRRSSGTSGAVLRFADLVLDATTHEVHRGDRLIELTRTEFLLLELFLEHPRQVLTPDVISERVWGQVFGPHSNSIKVYIGYLRRKTEAGGEVRLIHTVRGVGYVMRTP
jgi:two-component system response regulator MprA